MRFEFAFLDKLTCISSHSIGTGEPERKPKDIEYEYFETEILVTFVACILFVELEVAEGVMINNIEYTIHCVTHYHDDQANHMALE